KQLRRFCLLALSAATLTGVAGVNLVPASASPTTHTAHVANSRPNTVTPRTLELDTWAGVWNSDFGPLTLDAGGSGSYTGFNPGTVTGSVSNGAATGEIDVGTWTQPGTPTKNGTFEFT